MLWILLAAAAAASPAPPAHPPRGTLVTASGLRIRTLKPGTGPAPGPNDAVLIDYVGRLATGKVFDKADRAGMMVSGTVPGFAEALQHMRAGGTYRVLIPPRLAYGAEGAGDGTIPPEATLDFTITLLEVGKPVRPPQ
jgi:FKBP-type peptidyl-prolyl cis-trans isomerase FkpA